MTEHIEAQKQVMVAAFEVGQAQRALEDAEKAFRAALDRLNELEGVTGDQPD